MEYVDGHLPNPWESCFEKSLTKTMDQHDGWSLGQKIDRRRGLVYGIHCFAARFQVG